MPGKSSIQILWQHQTVGADKVVRSSQLITAKIEQQQKAIRKLTEEQTKITTAIDRKSRKEQSALANTRKATQAAQANNAVIKERQAFLKRNSHLVEQNNKILSVSTGRINKNKEAKRANISQARRQIGTATSSRKAQERLGVEHHRVSRKLQSTGVAMKRNALQAEVARVSTEKFSREQSRSVMKSDKASKSVDKQSKTLNKLSREQAESAAKTKKSSTVVKKQTKDIKSLNKSSKKGILQAAKWGVAWTGTYAIIRAGINTIRALASSMLEVNTMMARVSTVTRTTGENHEEVMSNMRRQAGDYANKTGQSLNDVIETFFHLGCFPAGQKIYSEYGIVNIEDVNIGDKVLGSSGKMQKVKEVMVRECDEGSILNIKPRNLLPFKVTPNHPIYAIKPDRSDRVKRKQYKFSPDYCKIESAKWYHAGDLISGDIVVLPLHSTPKETVNINFDIKRHVNNLVNSTEKLTEDWSWFLGLYMGDGHLHEDRICISINSKDNKLINKVTDFIYNIGYSPRIINKERNVTNVEFSSNIIVRFISDNIGRYAHLKKIPEFMYSASEANIIAFTNGYIDADGCIINIKDHHPRISISTVSENIVYGMPMLLGKIGIVPGVFMSNPPGTRTFPDGKTYNTRQSYNIIIEKHSYVKKILPNIEYESKRNRDVVHVDDKYIYTPISCIDEEKFNGLVYNFETEDNTYVSSVLVHNSAGLDVEKQMAGMDKIMNVVIGTFGDTKQVARLVAGTYNLFGKEITEATTASGKMQHIADVLSFTFSNQQVELDEIAGAMSLVGSAAGLIDIKFSELISTIGFLNTGLLRGTRAGTSLLNSMVKVSQNSDKLKESFGLAFDPTKPLDYVDIMEQLADRLGQGKLSMEDFRKLIAVFGLRGARATALIVKRFNEWRKAVKAGTKDFSGFAKKMKDEIENTLPRQLARFKNIAIDALTPDEIPKWWTKTLKGINDAISSTLKGGPIKKEIQKSLREAFEFSDLTGRDVFDVDIETIVGKGSSGDLLDLTETFKALGIRAKDVGGLMRDIGGEIILAQEAAGELVRKGASLKLSEEEILESVDKVKDKKKLTLDQIRKIAGGTRLQNDLERKIRAAVERVIDLRKEEVGEGKDQVDILNSLVDAEGTISSILLLKKKILTDNRDLFIEEVKGADKISRKTREYDNLLENISLKKGVALKDDAKNILLNEDILNLNDNQLKTLQNSKLSINEIISLIKIRVDMNSIVFAQEKAIDNMMVKHSVSLAKQNQFLSETTKLKLDIFQITEKYVEGDERAVRVLEKQLEFVRLIDNNIQSLAATFRDDMVGAIGDSIDEMKTFGEFSADVFDRIGTKIREQFIDSMVVGLTEELPRALGAGAGLFSGLGAGVVAGTSPEDYKRFIELGHINGAMALNLAIKDGIRSGISILNPGRTAGIDPLTARKPTKKGLTAGVEEGLNVSDDFIDDVDKAGKTFWDSAARIGFRTAPLIGASIGSQFVKNANLGASSIGSSIGASAGNVLAGFIGKIGGLGAGFATGPWGALISIGASIFGGIIGASKKREKESKDIDNTLKSGFDDALKSAFDRTNKELQIVNRNLTDIKTEIQPFILPDSFFFGANLPRFHSGGLVEGSPGQEVPIMAMAGETVIPAGQASIVIENITVGSDAQKEDMVSALNEVFSSDHSRVYTRP